MVSVKRQSYRLAQLAERLGVAKRTVMRMADDGRLPKPIRLGRVIIWDAEAIERWIEAGCPRQPGLKGGVR